MKFNLKKDLSNERFGKLLVIEPVGKTPNRHIIWRCICDCGNELRTASTHLLSGHTTSCGCYLNNIRGKATITHGKSKSSTYKVWCEIIERTSNPNSKKYERYGGKGITICQRWRDSFEAFLEDMGERPKGTSIDRINNLGNYEPGNCRWADHKTQCRNRSSNINLTFRGESKTLVEWCEELDLKYSTILCRIKRGWSTEAAFLTPIRAR